MPRDYYDVLGLQESASADDIKQAYRKLSKEWHPDKHKGDKKAEEKFKKINEAYETLNDPKKKQMYDHFGTTGSGYHSAGSGSSAGSGAGFGGFDFSGFTGGGHMDFSDLFEGFFGGKERRRQPREERGDDREISVTIAFMEAVSGTKRELRVRKLVACKACSGSGAESGGKLVVCEKCEGTGQIIRQSQSFFGLIQQSAVCTDCRGSGKVPEHPCKACRGEGRIADDATIMVAVPAGIGDGQSLRIRGEGDAARREGTSGDLYVRIRVEQDKRFARDGDDINTTVSIGVPDAVLGAAIPIETVHGPVQLKIHPGTQSGQVFRIKHKGMPVLNTGRFGDHYVTVNVEIPSKTSREVRHLVEEWKRLS